MDFKLKEILSALLAAKAQILMHSLPWNHRGSRSLFATKSRQLFNIFPGKTKFYSAPIIWDPVFKDCRSFSKWQARILPSVASQEYVSSTDRYLCQLKNKRRKPSQLCKLYDLSSVI